MQQEQLKGLAGEEQKINVESIDDAFDRSERERERERE